MSETIPLTLKTAKEHSSNRIMSRINARDRSAPSTTVPAEAPGTIAIDSASPSMVSKSPKHGVTIIDIGHNGPILSLAGDDDIASDTSDAISSSPEASAAAAFIREQQEHIANNPNGMRKLLESMRDKHTAYAAMNSECSKISATRARGLGIATIIVGVLATIVASIIEKLTDTEWTVLFMQISAGIMVAFTAIETLMDFAKRGAKFSEAKNNHIRAVDLIDIALACDDDSTQTINYDYTSVLEEVQNIHDGLKKSNLEIIQSVGSKYPQYEAPWNAR